ncbi:DNA polymerase [bacterium]|nr:DNA polymerase [bacterium]
MAFFEDNNQFVKAEEEETYKIPSISPFDFLSAINYTKEQLIVDQWSERQYQPYIVNKGLSYGSDTIIQANEMNSRPHIEKTLQFQFLINTIRPRKRFNKWIKASKIEAIDIVKQYYGYSNEKARQIMPLLTDEQIQIIKTKLNRGGHGN